MKVEVIVSSIISIIIDIIISPYTNMVWTTLFQSVAKIGEVTKVQLPITWWIAVKIVEFAITFIGILSLVIAVRNIFYSDRPTKPPKL